MKTISYTKTIKPFHQKIILFQLAVAIGMPFGMLLLFLLIIKAKEALIFVSLFLSISVCVVIILFREIEVRFKIDHTGITSEPSQKQLKINTRLNRLSFLAGLFSRKLTVSSAAYLSQSNQIQHFRWNHIKHIENKGNTFIITNRQNQKIILVTNTNNYSSINEILQQWRKGQDNE